MEPRTGGEEKPRWPSGHPRLAWGSHSVSTGRSGRDDVDNGMSDGWGWGAWLAMVLVMLGVLAAVVWILFLVWRNASGGPSEAPPSARDTPEGILAERLARGEIDAEEYRQRLKALRVGVPPA